MHNKCNVLESSQNHSPLQSLEKFSSMKLVPGAQKVGDRCIYPILIHLRRGGEEWETPCEIHCPDTGSPITTHRTINFSLPTTATSYQHISEGPFTTVPFTHYITSTSYPKITRDTKRQKTQFEKNRKDQNQTQILQGCWNYQITNLKQLCLIC